jgi:hypothetical protein
MAFFILLSPRLAPERAETVPSLFTKVSPETMSDEELVHRQREFFTPSPCFVGRSGLGCGLRFCKNRADLTFINLLDRCSRIFYLESFKCRRLLPQLMLNQAQSIDVRLFNSQRTIA